MVPQRGVLSLWLYTIYVASLERGLPAGVVISQFADDIAVYTDSKILDQSKEKLEKFINIINEKLHGLGLELSPQKIQIIRFTKKNNATNRVSIMVNGYSIESRTDILFLGITFDQKLTFEQHIVKVQRKSLRALNLVKLLRRTWWGSDSETLILIYEA